MSSSGAVPPGNAPGIKDWTQGGTRTIKPELKLTPGGGLEHLTIPMEQVIQQVVDSHKVSTAPISVDGPAKAPHRFPTSRSMSRPVISAQERVRLVGCRFSSLPYLPNFP